MWSNTVRRQMREEKVLLCLSKMKFATREQLQQVKELELGNERNALKVLGQMKELIQVKNHLGRNVYYLAKKGADMVGIEGLPSWSTHIDHHLLRNDIYVHYQCPLDWEVERDVELRPVVGDPKILRPDARFTVDGRWHFLEVDRTQSMVENKKKLDLYSQLNHLIESGTTLIFYTTTPMRKETISKYAQEKGLTFRVITKQDLA